jgi:hypothetical protein
MSDCNILLVSDFLCTSAIIRLFHNQYPKQQITFLPISFQRRREFFRNSIRTLKSIKTRETVTFSSNFCLICLNSPISCTDNAISRKMTSASNCKAASSEISTRTSLYADAIVLRHVFIVSSTKSLFTSSMPREFNCDVISLISCIGIRVG